MPVSIADLDRRRHALVLENRRRVARHLDGSSDGVVTLYQEHGTTAREVTAADRASAAACRCGDLDDAGSRHRRADSRLRACAAGRSCGARRRCRARRLARSLDGIVESAVLPEWSVSAPTRAHQRRRRACIGRAAYEVGPEFETQFYGAHPPAEVLFAPRQCRPSAFRSAGLRRPAPPRSRNRQRRSVFRPAHTRTKSLFFSYRRKTQRKSPIMAVKSPPSSWLNRTIHRQVIVRGRAFARADRILRSCHLDGQSGAD